MLDQNDIKQIGTLLEGTEQKLTTLVEKTEERLTKFVQEELEENNKKLTKEIVGQVVLEVGEFITDRVLPQIDEISTTITTLATKDDLTRGVTDIKGTLVAQLRTEDQKVNLLITFLKEKNVLNDQQWKALKELQVFPAVEIS